MSTLLTIILSVVAQSRISSSRETHHFGQIEWKRPISVEYTITNTGDKPLTLTNVTISCACSVVNWTKTPTAPGEKGTVGTTFDARTLGYFSKPTGVYSNAQPGLAYLNLDKEVTQKVKDPTKAHPYAIGQIRIDCTDIDFPDVYSGEKPAITLGVVNLSDRPYEPVLMHLPLYLKMKTNPTVLLKGKKGTIILTLDTKQLMDLDLTQSSVYPARFADGKVSEEDEIPMSVILPPGLSGIAEQDKALTPAIRLSESRIDPSRVLAKKSKTRHDIVITSTGRSPLQTSKLQVSNPAVGVALKRTILQSGESTRLRVTALKKNLGKRKRHLRVLMITSDSVQPKVKIDVKATSNEPHS